MDRTARLLSTSTRSSRILEIGPSHAPVAPKAQGWNTFIVDHASDDDLRRKYAAIGINTDAIETVDAIWEGGLLHDVVPKELHGTFDTLIASHVIEHIPDPAGFLVSAQQLLNATGSVVLAVPDRRFCFDYFKPPTMTGDILEAYASRRSRHALRTVWNQAAYSASWDGTTAWGQHPVHEPALTSAFAEARSRFQSYSDDPSAPYLDCHAWHFTPAGFAMVILELGLLGVIDWHVDSLHGPEGCEFLVVLRRQADVVQDAALLQARRTMLLRQQLQELREQVGFAPDGGAAPGPAPLPAALDRTYAASISELTGLLRQNSDSLEGLQNVALKMGELNRFAEALAESEHVIAAQRDEAIALRHALEQRTAEQARSTELLAVRNADLRFAQTRLATLSEMAERWRSERDIILASRSWRIGAPLRLASRVLRSLVPPFRGTPAERRG